MMRAVASHWPLRLRLRDRILALPLFGASLQIEQNAHLRVAVVDCTMVMVLLLLLLLRMIQLVLGLMLIMVPADLLVVPVIPDIRTATLVSIRIPIHKPIFIIGRRFARQARAFALRAVNACEQVGGGGRRWLQCVRIALRRQKIRFSPNNQGVHDKAVAADIRWVK